MCHPAPLCYSRVRSTWGRGVISICAVVEAAHLACGGGESNTWRTSSVTGSADGGRWQRQRQRQGQRQRPASVAPRRLALDAAPDASYPPRLPARPGGDHAPRLPGDPAAVRCSLSLTLDPCRCRCPWILSLTLTPAAVSVPAAAVRTGADAMTPRRAGLRATPALCLCGSPLLRRGETVRVRPRTRQAPVAPVPGCARGGASTLALIR